MLDEARERLALGKFLNKKLERFERFAASHLSLSQRVQSAPVTSLWQSACPSPYLQSVPVTSPCQSASFSPCIPTPPLRAGNKRRRADDDSGNYGVDQSGPAAKKGRLDDGSCGDCSALIETARKTNESGYQSEEMSDNKSVLAETNEGEYQREEVSNHDSVLVETDEDGYQSEDDSDDDSMLADFNDEDSDMPDVTAPFEAELQREVSKAKSAPCKDPNHLGADKSRVGFIYAANNLP